MCKSLQSKGAYKHTQRQMRTARSAYAGRYSWDTFFLADALCQDTVHRSLCYSSGFDLRLPCREVRENSSPLDCTRDLYKSIHAAVEFVFYGCKSAPLKNRRRGPVQAYARPQSSAAHDIQPTDYPASSRRDSTRYLRTCRTHDWQNEDIHSRDCGISTADLVQESKSHDRTWQHWTCKWDKKTG